MEQALYDNFVRRHELKELKRSERALIKYGLIRDDGSGLSLFGNWDHICVFRWLYATSRDSYGYCVITQPYGVDQAALEELVAATSLTAFVYKKELGLSWHNPQGTDLIALVSLKMSGHGVYNSFAARPCSWYMRPAAKIVPGFATAATRAAAPG